MNTQKRYTFILWLFFLLFLSCVKLDPEKEWDNPLDPFGKKYFPPKVEAMADTVVLINKEVVLRAKASDSNGHILGFRWYFRAPDGLITDSVECGTEGSVTRVYSRNLLGRNVAYVKSMDNDSLWSQRDSVVIDVRYNAPTLVPIRDTIVRMRDIVTIRVSAQDNNREIIRYFWRWSGASSGYDSTVAPEYSFSNPAGGPVSVVWGAMDDDTVMVSDTFKIYYNRPPSHLVMLTPAEGAKAQFKQFDKKSCRGSVTVSFRGSDPDSLIDSLRYALYLAREEGQFALTFKGNSSQVDLTELDTGKVYRWKLVAYDLMNDTLEASGSFRTVYMDVVPPVITLKGPNPLKLNQMVPYSDPGATALDNINGDLSGSIVASGDTVNIMAPGTYTRTYTVADSMQNSATVSRTVVVEKKLVVENFDDSIPGRTTLAILWGAVGSDSAGCWNAYTDKITGGKTYFDPDPFKDPLAPFKDVVVAGGGTDGTRGFRCVVYVDKSINSAFWRTGFYLKRKGHYYDLSGLDSLTFDVRGDDVENPIRVQFTDPHIDSLALDKRWGYVGAEFAIIDSWRHYAITPAMLAGAKDSPGNGLTWNTVKKNVSMIQFVNPNRDFYEQAISIDNVVLHGDFRNSGLDK